MDIAREHFFYRDPVNVKLIFADARTYVNKLTQQYDVVVVDVYGNTDIPFTFMTQEYGKALRRVVRPGGVVMVNIIAGEQGSCQTLLSALEAPYRAHFSQRALRTSVATAQQASLPHNIIGVYGDKLPHYEGYRDIPIPLAKPFTDDYAPAERLRQGCAA